MNEIFNPYGGFMIVYIDDVLIFSESLEKHWKHLRVFYNKVKENGLVVSARKIKLFQTKVQFLGHNIEKGLIIPIDRAIVFVEKFPDEIKEKRQLQRFLGSLNYISDFYQELAYDAKALFARLKKNPPEWTETCTRAVQKIKQRIKEIPCLAIPHPDYFKIVETDASKLGYGGILKQKMGLKEVLVRFTSGTWKSTQINYPTIKKEIQAIVLVISKFQDDLLNKKFLLRIDCKSAKSVLEKHVKNLASKQIFAR